MLEREKRSSLMMNLPPEMRGMKIEELMNGPMGMIL
jgi:hypothetical protein